jgi:hypothetical protein
MKQVVLIIILACLSFFPANAQDSPLEEGEQPLDMLVAETLDALMDTLSTFNHIRITDVEFGHRYDTSLYLVFGGGFSNNVVAYSKHKPSAIEWGKNGRMAIYSYDESSQQKWILTKKIKTRTKINVAVNPVVTFYHDTVYVYIGSYYLSWDEFHGKKRWGYAFSDWISCKFAYSEAEKRWVMVESDFGGI